MSEAPARSASLGELLHDARLRAGLELSEVAAKTHVRKTYLEALETESFDALPEDVYARNFLRLYARTVGVDPEDALARFDAARGRSRSSTRAPRGDGGPADAASAGGGAAVDAAPARRNGRERGTTGAATAGAGAVEAAGPRRRPAVRTKGGERDRPGLPPGLMPLLMTIVLAGALVGVAVWGFNQLLFRPERALAGTDTPAAPTAQREGGAGAGPAADGGLTAPIVSGEQALPDEILLSVETDPPGAEVSVDAFPLPGTTPILDVPVSARDERTVRVTREGYLPYEGTFDMTFDREVSIGLEPVSAEAGDEVDDAAATGPDASDGEVVLVVTEPTWLEAYQSTARGQGERLVYTTAQPGERFAFSRPLYLHVGNAAGLEVSVDGGPPGPFGSGGAVTGQAFPAE